MTVLHPCLHCHRKSDCQIKRDMHVRLRGSGVTKATLRCKVPESDFPPGSIVSVRAFEMRWDEDGYRDITSVAVDRLGVIRQWRAGKAWVVLNSDQEIQKLDDPNDKIGLLHCTSDRLTRIGDHIISL